MTISRPYLVRAMVLVLGTVLFAGCSAPRRDSTPTQGRSVAKGSPGNPPFYEVLGKRYYVLASAKDYEEVGVASWYGPKFHGNPTSSGRRFDMYAMTAAHKSLPLPTRVRVTNLGNGKIVDVTVNDRGPFVHNRIIDLSYAAAEEIDMIREGTAMVRVEVLRDAAVAAANRHVDAGEAAPEAALFLQVGAFGDPVNAQRMRSLFKSKGIGNVAILSDRLSRPVLHRVRIGPLNGVADYDRLVALAAQMNVLETHLVVEPPGQYDGQQMTPGT